MNIPPFSEEAEMGVIGSLLMDADRAFDICIGKRLDAELFYLPQARLVYESMVQMYRKNTPIDLGSVINTLKVAKTYDTIGGTRMLEQMIDKAPPFENFSYHVEIITQKAALRKWIAAGQSIMDMAYDENLEEIQEIVSQTEDQVTNILYADQLKSESIEAAVEDLSGRMNLLSPVIAKIPSSINTVRNRIVGWPIGRLSIIASRPGIGKTSLACCEGLFAAKRGTKVSILTFEMSKEEYTARIACINGEIDVESYFDGKLTEQEQADLKASLAEIAKLPIRMSDKSMNIRQVKQWIKNESKKSSMIIIDHFLLIRKMAKKGQREDTIYGEWSRELRDAAKKYNVALLVLSQLHRYTSTDRNGRRIPPSKSNLKETSCLEEDAYLLVLLDDQPIENVSNYQLIIDKHRNGWSGTVPVEFAKRYTKFKGIGVES